VQPSESGREREIESESGRERARESRSEVVGGQSKRRYANT
jgi:hypothetical protein